MNYPALKEYTEQMAKNIAQAIVNFEIKEVGENGTFKVVASTEGVDRAGEVILVKGWDLENYKKNPIILFAHDYWSLPVGKATNVYISEDGKQLIAEGYFASTESAQEVRKLYDEKILVAVSVGFMPMERNGNVITKAQLLEISFVPVPCNPDAVSLEKTQKLVKKVAASSLAQKIIVAIKEAVPFEETPKADEAMEWDAEAAQGRIAKWASEDGSGEPEKIDWEKYAKGFAWRDEANKESFGGYKLPHHDIVDDELKVVWMGTIAAMGAILGARDGVEIPEAEVQAVYDHLAGHYAQFEKEPPELKTYTEEELRDLFPDESKGEGVEQRESAIRTLHRMKNDVNAIIDAYSRELGVSVNHRKVEVKEGRVLSTKNRSLVKAAIDALLELYEATEPEKSLDVDIQKVLKDVQSIDKLNETVIRALKGVAKTL